MKKFILTILPIMLFTMSCDVVDRPYEEQDNDDDTTIVEAEKKVILSDFTAIYCTYCPKANEIAAELEDAYGKENVIVIGIHVGELAKPRENDDHDFRTKVGNELFSQFAGPQTGLPIGQVNRIDFGRLIERGEWSAVVPEELSKTSNIEMNLELDYNPSIRELSVTVNSKFLEGATSDDRLSIYITEDSIVNRQKDVGDKTIEDYVHNHVLRASLNGTWGDQLSPTGAERDETITKNYTYNVPQKFRAEKLRVIAFVNDNESFEIKQATAEYIYDKSE